ncbi:MULTISPECIES: ABC transporter ATP-binding protein [Halocynthiibacter]|uniref:Sn-glycerol-3-phosphate ABC transporter ATP-binding protein UgpC n=1 Tax=Halocynthiibacter halioticoli TaxID=2986804 RepID=A0AAE3J3Q2_9RHOB|nr:MULTISPECIES: sn-glycerol-3-phosphate ABC transporter ATP-binding protein UgpC [Halocynthiibacter]MCV6824957.1 sn-glycerol-3-phosphate ABC transporter ATP-binding protein UgpC [Halocynthiibacter halioticoli]MCW4057958.1 sn-glycerol-3-phosphate ABC transporter ATP-binding protein UgpC [Halocynthiibacter sp. SDUM655004]
MGSVTLRNIRKSYGAVEVLHGIDLDIKDGEFTVLVGPSGCGKSTLLRSIAGLETISDGEISVDDTVINTLVPKERDIAMVFQNYALYPHMTVAKNMGFSLRLAKESQEEIDKKVKAAAEILDLNALLDRYPRQLSGGQRQRVAMGRAIVRDPKVFLFDEPLSNLDAKLRVQMRSEIKELHQRLKTTTIYVTHDQIEAMTMADKIVVMRGGHVEQIGSPIELYDNPASVFVAGFIGSPAMNFIDAVGDGKALKTTTQELLGTPNATVASGQKVIAGFRPEDIRLAEKGIAAKVALIEPTGAETQLTLRTENEAIIMTTRDRITHSVGDQVFFEVIEGKLHCFDSETERSLAEGGQAQ